MSKNCLESAGATPSTAELEVLVNEITTGTSTKAASSRNRLRLFSFLEVFPSIVVFYQEYAAANGVGQDEKLNLPEI